jgi:hypothetical protein
MRKFLLGVATAVAVVAVAAVPAGAAPTNAKGAFTGQADCGSAGTFGFVVNNANGQGQGTMNNPKGQAIFAPAHLSNGQVFHPTAFDLTFTFTAPDGSTMSFLNDAARKNQVGDVSCTLSGSQASPQGTFSISGSVVGTLT